MNAMSLSLALHLGPLAQHKGRVLLSLIAIALGVALGYAVQLVNRSAVQEFEQAVRSLSGEADFNVRANGSGLDEAWYARISRLPEVALASPVIEADAKFIGRREPLPLLGLDVLRARQLVPGLLAGEAIDTLDTLRPDTIFLSAAAADELKAGQGDTVHVQSGVASYALRVAGVYAGGRTAYAWMDIAGAQAILGRIGRLDRIDIRLHPGTDAEAFRTRLQRALPPGIRIERPAETVQRNADLSRAYRVNLNVLALVALFTGGLLVFSAQALGIVRRRAQLALLRVLGMTRRGLLRMLLAEALLVGVLGSMLGLVAGYAVAALVLRHVGADLGAGAFEGVAAQVHVDPWSALVFVLAGLAAALLGSFAPAVEAARAAPAAALKAGDEQRSFARLRVTMPGLALLALGGAATALPPIDDLPIFGYIAIALLLIGTILLLPRIATACFALVRLPAGRPALQLALAQLRGAPGQAMLSLAAIVASVSLFVSMAIMVSSFRVSLEDWLDRVLPADLYVRVAGGSDTAYLTPDDQQRLQALPGLRRVDFVRSVPLVLDPERPAVQLLARPIDPADPGRWLALVEEAHLPQGVSAAHPPVWLSEAVAEVYGYRVGATIKLPLGGMQRAFTVAGIWRDYARQHGAVAIERGRYVELTGDRNASEASLWLADAGDAGAVRTAILRMYGEGRVEVAGAGELRARSLGIFDRTFAVTYALEIVALLIGLTALSASFGALVLLRRREFGMLRHLGMTRRQIGAMLAGEGLLVSGLGLAVGMLLGWLISLVLIHVVNRQSFHWSMDLHMPILTLLAFLTLLLGLAALTALASARHAMSTDVVRAVREDW
jgi:putative ABC transport system permease protein